MSLWKVLKCWKGKEEAILKAIFLPPDMFRDQPYYFNIYPIAAVLVICPFQGQFIQLAILKNKTTVHLATQRHQISQMCLDGSHICIGGAPDFHFFMEGGMKWKTGIFFLHPAKGQIRNSAGCLGDWLNWVQQVTQEELPSHNHFVAILCHCISQQI